MNDIHASCARGTRSGTANLPDAPSENYAARRCGSGFVEYGPGSSQGVTGKENGMVAVGWLAGLFVFKKIVIAVIVELLKSR